MSNNYISNNRMTSENKPTSETPQSRILLDLTKNIKDYMSQPQPYTSNYYQDLTREKYEIRQAFQANNFTYIRNLPDNFHHKVILESKKERVENQKNNQGLSSFSDRSDPNQEKKNQMVQLWGGGYFEQFVYESEDYNWAHELSRREQLANQQKMRSISLLQFRPNDIRLKAKYQDPFQYEQPMLAQKNRKHYFEQKNKTYLFPFNIPDDTFDILRESISRQRVISEAKRLAGAWKPSQKEGVLTQMSKEKLDEIIKELRLVLSADWPNAKFMLGSSQDECIQVIFQVDKVFCNANHLVLYMNSILKDERLTQFWLRQNLQKWAHFDHLENTITFGLNPPWIQQYHYQSFYQLNPEFDRSAKRYTAHVNQNASHSASQYSAPNDETSINNNSQNLK